MLDQEAIFQSAKNCYISGNILWFDRENEYNPLVRKCSVAAYKRCSLNYNTTNRKYELFHNHNNYDDHLIIQHLGKFKGDQN